MELSNLQKKYASRAIKKYNSSLKDGTLNDLFKIQKGRLPTEKDFLPIPDVKEFGYYSKKKITPPINTPGGIQISPETEDLIKKYGG